MITKLSQTATFTDWFGKINEVIDSINQLTITNGQPLIQTQETLTILDGVAQTYVIENYPFNGITLAVTPGATSTLLVEYRITASGSWQEWPMGAISEYTEDVIIAPVQALRFTSTGNDGAVEINYLGLIFTT